MVTDKNILEMTARNLLNERGVSVDDIAELVHFLQAPYVENLDLKTCAENVNNVLKKEKSKMLL